MHVLSADWLTLTKSNWSLTTNRTDCLGNYCGRKRGRGRVEFRLKRIGHEHFLLTDINKGSLRRNKLIGFVLLEPKFNLSRSTLNRLMLNRLLTETLHLDWQRYILMIKLLEVQDFVLIRPQHFFNLQTPQPFFIVGMAQSSHYVLQQRAITLIMIRLSHETRILPFGYFICQLIQINWKMFNRVQFLCIEKQTRLKEGQTDRKRFRYDLICCILMISLWNEPHFFRREVGQLSLEGSFVEVGALVRPTVQISYFDLTFLVDENVIGSDIADLTIDSTEVTSTWTETVEQVPEFFFFKVFAHFYAVLYFFFKKIGIVFVEDLSVRRFTLTDPTFPQNPLLLY